MITRVALAGVDLDLGDVFAAVTIRHGRGSADDPPMTSTATLSLVNVTRELTAAFRVADPLVVYLGGDVPRFTGRITDAQATDAGLAIIAVSSLSWISSRPIGAGAWPAESWSARVARVFAEAAPEVTLSLIVGDSDPALAARAADPTTLGDYLTVLLADEPAAIADLPNGAVLVQALTARRAIAEVALDSLLVAYSPAWAMVDDVSNVVTVSYPGATAQATDELSRDRFEDRPLSIQTDLSDPAAAIARANLAATRGGFPEWVVEELDYLDLDTALAIGTPIVVGDLPAWAPAEEYRAIVEGWVDSVEADEAGELEWTMRLTLSAPRLSGVGIRWMDIPAGVTWADAAAVGATWRHPELLLTA